MCSLPFVMLFIGSLLTTVSVPELAETVSVYFLFMVNNSLRNVLTFTNPIQNGRELFRVTKEGFVIFFHFVLKRRFSKVWPIGTFMWQYYWGSSSMRRAQKPRRQGAVLYAGCASSVLEQR